MARLVLNIILQAEILLLVCQKLQQHVRTKLVAESIEQHLLVVHTYIEMRRHIVYQYLVTSDIVQRTNHILGIQSLRAAFHFLQLGITVTDFQHLIMQYPRMLCPHIFVYQFCAGVVIRIRSSYLAHRTLHCSLQHCQMGVLRQLYHLYHTGYYPSMENIIY